MGPWPDRMSPSWRALAEGAVRRISDELERTERHQVHDATRAGIRDLLDGALAAIRRAPRWWEWSRDLVNGTRVETAWRAIHQASEMLLLIQSEDLVHARVPEVQSTVERNLDPKDPTRVRFEKQVEDKSFMADPLPRAAREDLRVALEAAHHEQDDRYVNTRKLRNRLLLGAAVMLILLFVLAIVHALDTSFLSMCRQPQDTLQAFCPGRGGDIFEVELLGVLGGLLSVLLAAKRLQLETGPYNLGLAQVVLKAVAGAGTGLIGVLLLQGGFFGSLAVESKTALLGYATVFGLTQQLFTGWVDKHAQEVLGSEES
jgi:hypothetical protein